LRQPNLRRVREVASQQALQRSRKGGTIARPAVDLARPDASRRDQPEIGPHGACPKTLMQRLSSAGWRSGDALTMYLFAKFALPFIVPVIAVLWMAPWDGTGSMGGRGLPPPSGLPIRVFHPRYVAEERLPEATEEDPARCPTPST